MIRSPRHIRRQSATLAEVALCLVASVALPCSLHAQQSAADAPASIPAGTLAPTPVAPPPSPDNSPAYRQIPAKQAREASDAYVAGQKLVAKKDFSGAVQNFSHAVQLDPGNRDYTLALLVAKGNRVSELIHLAAKALQAGDAKRSDELLQDARQLDPENPLVLQHFGTAVSPQPTPSTKRLTADQVGATIGGPLELDITPGQHSFHLQTDPRNLLQTVYRSYGIAVTFDASVNTAGQVAIDLDDVNFADATRVAQMLTHTFAVNLQPHQALLLKDSVENKQEFQPLIEQTVYLPGYTQEQMTELANIARSVFDLKQVTSSANDGYMLLRGDEASLKLVDATFADMLDGGTDVQFDINLYEVSTSKIRDVGATLPSSAGVFSIAAEADSIVSQNASLLSQAISSGLLTLNGSPLQNLISEIEFLIAAGAVSSSQYTNLLGTFGGGLAYAGLYLGSNSSFQLALTETDSRLLDAVKIRAGSGQLATFRQGERYPVITGTYSSGISSSLASSLAGLNVNGTNVSSLLQQYLGGSQATTPEFQYEDLGLTLKLTPTVQHGSDVRVKLDMKLEALGGASIDQIPILNNRTMTSEIAIPEGKTAMVATLVSRTELRSIDGIPGLSDIPGFSGTDKSKSVDTDELMMTITPHIVRRGPPRIASRRLAAIHTVEAP
jgi:Flp pilus assembly secretin CpaC